MSGDGLDLLDADELALTAVAELAGRVLALEQRVRDLEAQRPRIIAFGGGPGPLLGQAD